MRTYAVLLSDVMVSLCRFDALTERVEEIEREKGLRLARVSWGRASPVPNTFQLEFVD